MRIKSYIINEASRTGGGFHNNMIHNALKDVSELEYGKRSLFKNDDSINDYNIYLYGQKALYYSRSVEKRSIASIYHIDNSVSVKGIIKAFMNYPFEKNVIRNLKNIETIVTISNYWKTYFENIGHNNVRVIHTPFDFSKFIIKDQSIQDIREKYNLPDNFVYIGNCQKSKGVYQVYKILKNTKHNMITSGNARCNLPIPNLDLSYLEYLALLKASKAVITMSIFREGWNRTAHESMILGTPVIGSGLGGMGDLLRSGKQVICNDIHELPKLLDLAIENEQMKKDAIKYATKSKFSIMSFIKSWRDLIKEYVD